MTEHYLDRLARTINENWDAPALTDFYLTEDGTAQDTSRGNHYTYGEMYMEMLRLGELFKQLGLQKGDHIAICGTNSAHWAIAYLAIAAYQGVVVTVLHSQSPEDIARQIDFSDAKALFTNELIWKEISASFADEENKLAVVISLADWSLMHSVPCVSRQLADAQPKVNATFTEASLRGQCHFSHGESDDLAMICFTSGSTGISKGVMLSYRNVSHTIGQTYSLYPLGLHKDYLSLLPYAHMSGLIADVLSQLVFGRYIHISIGTLHVKDIKKMYDLISPYMVACVPDLFRLVFTQKRTGSLLVNNQCGLIFMGGAKQDSEIEQTIVGSGIPLSIIYGQTEATVSLSPYGQHRITSAGRICLGMTARIAPNGEILVKGENVMLGYYKNPEATAQKIDADGWLHTGDRGHLDEDGYLYVEGRLEQDMIVLPNGENIHPDNIERKINALPEVAESIVIARGGNLVAIVVPSSVEHQELRRFILRTINPQLPSYSQLYDVECINEPLVRTAKQTLKRYLYK